ncbi:hypothetical protein J14TS5_45070 [Paenibacillus lautus]|nr:hypothetical protein J14TS5_45070 [Paenibacillus lautus]
MQTKSVNVVEARISKLFIHYAMPDVIASLAMSMYGILNGIFLGRVSRCQCISGR